MQISNVVQVSPVTIHFTLEYKGIERVRILHIQPDYLPVEIAGAMAVNINHFAELVDTDSLSPYNTAEHIAGIERDARRYGCD